jgi:hypothetical protein
MAARNHSSIAAVKSALGNRLRGKEAFAQEPPRGNSKQHYHQPEDQSYSRQHKRV